MADDNERSGNSLLTALAHPTIVNPLAAYGDAAKVANGIWANREWQAKQAAGEAFQGAINPDGTPNQAALLQRLRGDPNAALAAQPSAQAGQDLDNTTFNTHMKRLTGLNAAAMALTAQYPNGVPQDKINAEIDRVGPQYGLSPQEMTQAKQSFTADPVSNSRTIIRNGISNLSAQDALHASRPTTTMHNVGGQDVPITQAPAASPNAGQLSVGGGPTITRTLTPGEQTETQPAIDPATGTPGTVPKGSKYNPDGSLKPPGWGNSGKYPTPGAAAAQTAPPGFTPTAQAPGVAEAQRQQAEASAKAGTKIYSDADAATTMKSQLLTMQSDLAKISTGPTSERAATVNAFLQKYGLPSGMSADEIASSEGFAKIAKQIALAQAGALGAGTDEKLTTSMGANPNRDLSKLGNQQIIAMLQGNADAIKARGMAYDQWKQTHPGADTNSFLTDFNKTFDPRVYQWGYQIKGMTPDQRTAAYNALPDKAEFRRKYNAAVAAKLIDPHGY